MIDFKFCKDCERPHVCGNANQCCRPCVHCGGMGTVDGHDYADPIYEYEDYNDPFMTCPSCNGTGLAKDMQFQ